MAVEDYWAPHTPAKLVYFAIWRPRDGYIWNFGSGTGPKDFVPLGSEVALPWLTSTEHDEMGGSARSIYVAEPIDLDEVNPGPPQDYIAMAYELINVSGNLVDADLTVDPAVARISVIIEDGSSRLTIENISNSVGVGTGDGSVTVDHNYGGVGVLKYITGTAQPIDNAVVRAFLKSEYDAGMFQAAYSRGDTRTDTNGEWEQPLKLDPETYVIEFTKQGVYGPDTMIVTVT